MFEVSVMTKALSESDTGLVSMRSGTNISLCTAYFDENKTYKAMVEASAYVFAGKLRNDICITVMNGSCDGYDRPTGIRYNSIEDFNFEWQIIDY